MMPSGLTRRSFLVGGTAGLCLARLTDLAAAAATPLNMQLGWLGGGNQLGEVCALRLGYFDAQRQVGTTGGLLRSCARTRPRTSRLIRYWPEP
jgi:hypothetical protein